MLHLHKHKLPSFLGSNLQHLLTTWHVWIGPCSIKFPVNMVAPYLYSPPITTILPLFFVWNKHQVSYSSSPVTFFILFGLTLPGSPSHPFFVFRSTILAFCSSLALFLYFVFVPHFLRLKYIFGPWYILDFCIWFLIKFFFKSDPNIKFCLGSLPLIRIH